MCSLLQILWVHFTTNVHLNTLYKMGKLLLFMHESPSVRERSRYKKRYDLFFFYLMRLNLLC